jgi:uncharacterized membrane protein
MPEHIENTMKRSLFLAVTPPVIALTVTLTLTGCGGGSGAGDAEPAASGSPRIQLLFHGRAPGPGSINSRGVVPGRTSDSRPALWVGASGQQAATPSVLAMPPAPAVTSEVSVSGVASAVNDAGVAVGTVSVSDFRGPGPTSVTATGVVWVGASANASGSVPALPVLLAPLPGDNQTDARDINNHGMIIGYSMLDRMATNPDGFLYREITSGPVVWPSANAAQPVALPLGQFRGQHAEVYALNDNGMVVGFVNSGRPLQGLSFYESSVIPVVWEDSSGGGSGNYRMTLLPLAAGFTSGVARDVNNSGQVVGSFSSVTTDPDNPYPYLPTPLLSQRAFVFHNGTMALLPPLPGVLRPNTAAVSINDRGWIVGGASVNAEEHSHAVLWRGDGNNGSHNGGEGEAIDLNTLLPRGSAWVLERATGINNVGQVLGEGTYRGQPAVFLLDVTDVINAR